MYIYIYLKIIKFISQFINDGASTSGTSNILQKDSDKENDVERQQAFSDESQFIIQTMPSKKIAWQRKCLDNVL